MLFAVFGFYELSWSFAVGIDKSSPMPDEFPADEQSHFELGSLSAVFDGGLQSRSPSLHGTARCGTHCFRAAA